MSKQEGKNNSLLEVSGMEQGAGDILSFYSGSEREILSSRAQLYSAFSDAVEQVQFLSAIRFEINNLGSFAVARDYVEQVKNVRNIISIPSAPPYLMGVVVLRGEAISVVDMESYINQTQAKAKAVEDSLIIFLNHCERRLGIHVNGDVGIVDINLSMLRPIRDPGVLSNAYIGLEENGSIVIDPGNLIEGIFTATTKYVR